VGGVDLHAEGAELAEPGDGLVGDAGLALDQGAVELGLAELPQARQELLTLADGGLIGEGPGMDQAQAQVAQEELAGEARAAPLPLPCGLGDPAGLILGGHRRSPRSPHLPTGSTDPYTR
jgi:hypothetical protein